MRHATSVVILIALGTVAALVAVRAAEKPAKDAEPVSALVVVEGTLSRDGVGRTEAVRIVDPKTIAKLESFFPKYDQRPSGNVAAGWEVGHRVYFDFPNGESVRVTVSANENAAFWSLGQGDFETNGDVTAFVESLETSASRIEG